MIVQKIKYFCGKFWVLKKNFELELLFEFFKPQKNWHTKWGQRHSFIIKLVPKKNFFYLNILKNDRETVYPMGHIEMLYYCVCVYYFHLRPFPHNSFSPSPRLKSAKIYLTRFLWLMHDVNTEWLLWELSNKNIIMVYFLIKINFFKKLCKASKEAM